MVSVALSLQGPYIALFMNYSTQPSGFLIHYYIFSLESGHFAHQLVVEFNIFDLGFRWIKINGRETSESVVELCVVETFRS